MLAYVPVVFDVYRPLKPHLRWTLQCLVAFADRTGRCFPSVRTLAEVTEISKSTVSRHLSQLEEAGAFTRHRRPGGGYTYTINSRFLPAARVQTAVSHPRKSAVPPLAAKEKTSKNKTDSAFQADLPSAAPWTQRLRGWETSHFWLPAWGPKPGEAGCYAPIG